MIKAIYIMAPGSALSMVCPTSAKNKHFRQNPPICAQLLENTTNGREVDLTNLLPK